MEIKTQGLKWIQRRASKTPVWVASAPGYEPRTVNLAHLRDQPEMLAAACAKQQGDMWAWQAGLRKEDVALNGTLGSILLKYHREKDSPYYNLRPTSRHPYDHYIARLIYEIGDRKIDKVTGINLQRWHDSWSEDGVKLAASKMMRAVLDAAISYGIMCRVAGCIELREVLKTTSRKIPNPKRRESVVTYDQVVALRAAAHADGRPSSALAYALVFETTLRLWDVIGQWWPLDSNLISDVISERMRKKWFGIRWEDIGEDMVLRYMPSKTSAKTGLSITFPLDRASMVMAELAHWSDEKRAGPVIVSEHTRVPYSSNRFGEYWRMDADTAGLPKTVWARDLRASGITEARAAGISTDDAAKVAGHASTKTTAAVYDRANLEAAGRFADARTAKRKKEG